MLVGVIFCLIVSDALAEILPPGFRPNPTGVHALVGGKVVVRPGEVLPEGIIVIRDGRFEAVGTGISIPAEARIWEAKGLTIYPGFIESYLPLGKIFFSTGWRAPTSGSKIARAVLVPPMSPTISINPPLSWNGSSIPRDPSLRTVGVLRLNYSTPNKYSIPDSKIVDAYLSGD